MSGPTISDESENFLHGNGVDGATGNLLLADVDAIAFADSLLKRGSDELTELLATAQAQKAAGKLALPFPATETDLTTTGWGVIFAKGIGQDIIEALQPLIEHRKVNTNGKVFVFDKENAFGPDETASGFLDRQGSDSLSMQLDKVPYYLLLVGTPEQIPLKEERFLSTQYAVGRLDLDSAVAYQNYAKAVVAHEQRSSGAPLLNLFGPYNQDDKSTPLSLYYLIDPLAKADLKSDTLERRVFRGGDATKARLANIFLSCDRPRIVVTATHGVALDFDNPQQDAMQGALLCQDWPGPKGGPVQSSHCFASADVNASIDAAGSFLLLYACFSGATPRQDEFWFANKNAVDIKKLANRAFTASLVKRLLGHERPPVAVLAHCDRAWGASFYRPQSSKHAALFVEVLRRIIGGWPIGTALGPISSAASSLGEKMHQYLHNSFAVSDKRVFLQHWVAERDARGYALFGDPAARLINLRSKS